MNVYTYARYDEETTWICEDCAETLKEFPGTWESRRKERDSLKGPFSDGGGKDYLPHHCGQCRKFLENKLFSKWDSLAEMFREHDESIKGGKSHEEAFSTLRERVMRRLVHENNNYDPLDFFKSPKEQTLDDVEEAYYRG